jgi:hypothetical protein
MPLKTHLDFREKDHFLNESPAFKSKIRNAKHKNRNNDKNNDFRQRLIQRVEYSMYKFWSFYHSTFEFDSDFDIRYSNFV